MNLKVLDLYLELLSSLLIFCLLTPKSLLVLPFFCVELLSFFLDDEAFHFDDAEILTLQCLLELQLLYILCEITFMIFTQVKLNSCISDIGIIPCLEPKNLGILNYAAKIQIVNILCNSVPICEALVHDR